MDQDFHYYGTYAAARMSGWDPTSATLMAQAANFVDFFNQKTYRGYWVYKKDKQELGMLEYPRYTFDKDIGPRPAMALATWAAFHFLPGNFEPNKKLKHPRANLPNSVVKDLMTEGIWKPRGKHQADRTKAGWRLTRPLSPLSRCLVEDTIELANSDKEVDKVLGHAPGLEYFLYEKGEKEVRDKFKKILIGVRAHVIADTWAHQDFAGVSDNINTYWDIKESWVPGKYGIYLDVADGQGFYYTVLGQKEKRKFISHGLGVGGASPVIVGGIGGKLGHGWMGHLPDISFVSYQYKPYWKKDEKDKTHTRNNIDTYLDALYDLRHMMTECNPNPGDKLKKIDTKLKTEVLMANWKLHGAKHPSIFAGDAWMKYLNKNGGAPKKLDMSKKPCDASVMQGGLSSHKCLTHVMGKLKGYGYGTFTLEIKDEKGKIIDFYLFQLAADYHFQYVKEWLLEFGGVGTSTKLKNGRPSFGTWGDKPGPLGGGVIDLAKKRVALRQQ